MVSGRGRGTAAPGSVADSIIGATPCRPALVRSPEGGLAKLFRSRGAPPSTLGAYAQQLTTALGGHKRDRALVVLLRAGDEGWDLREVENQIMVLAVTRLGNLWRQSRLGRCVVSAGRLAGRGSRALFPLRALRECCFGQPAPSRHLTASRAARSFGKAMPGPPAR